MNYSDILILAETTTRSQEIVAQQEILSKIKGINGYLESLLQKRARLDLEIRKSKKRITKLKKEVINLKARRTTGSSSLKNESFVRNFDKQEDIIFESLDSEILLSDSLLAEVAQLSLSE